MRSKPAGLALVALTALAAGLITSPVGQSAQQDDPLRRDLDTILASPAVRGAEVGLVVRRADTGEVLYDNHGDRRGQPASTNKLLTSATALEVLGPDYRFTTTVSATGRHHGPVLAGDLYLRGTGDPTLLPADIDALAGKVAASGVKVVSGRLVTDDTWFDPIRLGTGWAWDDEGFYYSAQISALTVSPDTDYDAGTVIVRVEPGPAGGPAKVTTQPPTDYVRIRNTAVTGQPGSPSDITVDREHGANVITVTGSIPAGGTAVQEWIAVWEPTGLAGSLFRDALARHGVRVLGGTANQATPPDARPLAGRTSMPLAQLQVPFLKLSNNMHAEILVKAAGRAVSGQGTWAAGLRVLGDRLGGLGVDKATMRMLDGSGLSRMDQLAPRHLASLLVTARSKPWFPAWYAALPVAGVADRTIGGTLRNRMRGTPAEGNVHAKTGSLTGVSGLAGYVTTADGRPLVFAMVVNNALVSVKGLEDVVAVRLASDRAGQSLSVPAVRATGPTAADDVECSWLKAC